MRQVIVLSRGSCCNPALRLCAGPGYAKGVSEHTLDAIMQVADSDHDGRVSYAEFEELGSSAQRQCHAPVTVLL